MGADALVIVPNMRKLIGDKLILAAFIFDFLFELYGMIKVYPNSGGLRRILVPQFFTSQCREEFSKSKVI